MIVFRAVAVAVLLLTLLLLPEVALAQASHAQTQGIIRPLTPNAAITSPLIEGFISAAQQIARSFATRVASEILTLLNYAFLIWLLLQIAQMMLGMTTGGSTFWNIVRRSAIYMIIAFMLTAISTGTYWTWFVEEPIRIATALSAEIMGRGGCGGSSAADAAKCLAGALEERFTNPLHASWESIKATQFSFLGLVSGAAFSQYAAGALLALASFIGLVFFSFFIMDVVLRILIMAMFSPVFVGAFLFNPTRAWATGAAWNLVGAVATLVGGAAVLEMLDEGIRRSLGGGGWPAIVAEIRATGSSYDSPINLDRAIFWQALFLCLVSVGIAKAISQMMASIFNSAAAGSPMAEKAAGIAAIPAKASIGAAAIGATYVGYTALAGANAAAGKLFGRGTGNAAVPQIDTQALKSGIGFGPSPPPFSGGPSTPGGSPGAPGSGPFGPGFGSGAGPLGGGSGGASPNPGTTSFKSGGTGPSPSSTSPTSGGTGSGPFGADFGSAPNAALPGGTSTKTPPSATMNSSSTAAAARTKPKGKNAYKSAFIYDVAKRVGSATDDAVDPMSRSGT